MAIDNLVLTGEQRAVQALSDSLGRVNAKGMSTGIPFVDAMLTRTAQMVEGSEIPERLQPPDPNEDINGS